MDRQPVQSSLIRSVGYDPGDSVLEIEIVAQGRTRVYEFHDVPYSVFTELMDADSKGTYFNEFVRDLYSYEELD